MKRFRMATASLCVLAMASASGTVFGQTTDLSMTIGQQLKSYGKVPVTRTISVSHTENICTRRYNPDSRTSAWDCHDVTRSTPTQQTTMETLTTARVYIESVSPVTYGAATSTALPSEMMVWDQTAIDCGPGNSTAQISMSKQTQHTESVTLTHSVVHTEQHTIGLSGGFPGYASINASVTIGQQTTDSTVSLSGLTDTGVRGGQGTYSLSPKQKVVGEMRVVPVHYSIPFSASVVANADLSANDKFKKLSEIFPDATSRTFTISGTLDSDAASDATLVFFSTPFDPSECHGLNGIVYPPEGLKPGTQLQALGRPQPPSSKH